MMTQPEFDTLVKQLEPIALLHPQSYKLRVLLLAILGYLYLFFMVIFLLLANGLLIYAFIVVHNIFIIKAGIAILALTYFVIRSLWVKLTPPEGIRLLPHQAPALFQQLDLLRRQLKAPNIHTVLLNNEFNAAIVQHPRLGIFGWQKNYLILGLPLMQALSVPQFTAALAHEYGHLSGAHGHFGAWIYRIRKTWWQLVTILEQKHSWGSALFNKFLLWYIPFFNAYSFVLARLNEYEADRCAAQIAGAHEAAQALVNVTLKAQFLATNFWPKLYAEADKRATPPYQPYTALSLAFSSKLATENNDHWLPQALQEQTNTADTHPSLSDRLAALGETAQLPTPVTETAAQQFLGEHLTELAQTLNQQWYSQIQTQWQQRYEYVQTAKLKLQELETRASNTQLTPQEAWHRASLTEELIDRATALPLYQSLLETNLQQVSAAYAVGRILLAQENEQGIEFIQRAMRQDSRSIVSGCEEIYNFLQRHHRAEEAQVYLEQARQKIQLDQMAQAEHEHLNLNDSFIVTTLSPEHRALMMSQLQVHQNIKRAYLVQKELKYLPEHPLYVLGIVRTFKLFRMRDDKVEFAQNVAKTLSMPGDFFVVVLDSEVKPLFKKMQKLAGALIYEKGKS